MLKKGQEGFFLIKDSFKLFILEIIIKVERKYTFVFYDHLKLDICTKYTNI